MIGVAPASGGGNSMPLYRRSSYTSTTPDRSDLDLKASFQDSMRDRTLVCIAWGGSFLGPEETETLNV